MVAHIDEALQDAGVQQLFEHAAVTERLLLRVQGRVDAQWPDGWRS